MAFDAVTWILCKQAAGSAASEAISGLSEGLKFKGVVPTDADLPASANDGDMYVVENPGHKAVWYNAQ